MSRRKIPALLKSGSAELIAKEYRRDKDTIPTLIKFLQNKSPALRHEAIKAFSNAGLLKGVYSGTSRIIELKDGTKLEVSDL